MASDEQPKVKSEEQPKVNGDLKVVVNGISKVEDHHANTPSHPSLLGLPIELRRDIIQYLRKLSDLLHVSLTCHTLRDAAIPVLYENINLPLGGPQDYNVHRVLSPRNLGLQHIRHLKIRVDQDLSRRAWHELGNLPDAEGELFMDAPGFYHSPAQAQVVLGMILELLPRDQLLSFNWNTWDALSTENWLNLYTTQRMIKQVEICPLDKALLPLVKKHPNIFNNLKNCTGLYLWPNTTDAVESGQIALQDMGSKISCLLLNGCGIKADAMPGSSIHDTSTAPGLITRLLFKHLAPFDKCEPLDLRELHLDGIEVYHASTTYLKVINFQKLESLILDECPGAANVFAEMCKAYARPRSLKRICWLSGNVDQAAITTFEEWLQSFKGLQYIHVDIGNVSGTLQPIAIKNHAETLRSLFVRFVSTAHDNNVGFQANTVEEICDRCQKLRQLSLPFSDLGVRTQNFFETEDIKKQVESLGKLPELETLSVQDWPFTHMTDDELRKPENVEYYHVQLSMLATRMFEMADSYAKKNFAGASRAKLGTIGFGLSHWSFYNGTNTAKLRQTIFRRGTLIDPYGVERMVAVKIDKRRLKEVDEDESILGWETGTVFKELGTILYRD